MSKKGFSNILLCLLIFIVVVGIGVLAGPYYWQRHFFKAPSTPAMPENLKENTVIQKALEQKTAIRSLDQLIDELSNRNIIVHPSFYMDKSDIIAFINELKSNEESQKIFRQFGQAGITIFLCDKYQIYNGNVFINIREGVKKTAEWLKSGAEK